MSNPVVFKKAALAAWGALTLILLFSVVLLVHEMRLQGQNPLAAPAVPAAVQTGAMQPAVRGTCQVALYFASPDGRLLVPETREIEQCDSTVENCKIALRELTLGPTQPLTPTLAPDTEVYAAYLLESGEFVINCSVDLLPRRQRSASSEALMAHSVVQTLTQQALAGKDGKTIRSVRFLIEGYSAEETFPDGIHVDLSVPITPDASWVAGPDVPGTDNG